MHSSPSDSESVPSADAPHLEQYHDNVRALARGLKRRYNLLMPVEELESAGFIGLYGCWSRYDAAQGPFWRFAKYSVESAMFEEVRRTQTSKKLLAFARANADAAASALTEDDKPTDREWIQDFVTIAENTRIGFQLFSHAPPPRDLSTKHPEQLYSEFEWSKRLHSALDGLPPRLQRLVHQRYFDEMSVPSMAKLHDIDDTRIWHLLRDALNRLRSQLDVDGT